MAEPTISPSYDGRTLIVILSMARSGSSLVAKLSEKRSVQIAIRLPGADLERAREVADRRGIGYQTLLKMLVHQGLAREARRQ